ncbi:MAG: SUKH-3 domain-containing protein [Pseudonocardiaceae bacterium]
MEGDHDSTLAIDEAGRVFALDHVGEWYLGESIDAALITLITGSQPPRLDDDGTWSTPPEYSGDPCPVAARGLHPGPGVPVSP